MKAKANNHCSDLIGLNDVTGKPIREGDVLLGNSSFRFVVVWNEFIKDFSMIPVPCFNTMRKDPYMKPAYLEDMNALDNIIIQCWGLKIKCDIYQNPSELNDNEL